MSTAPLPLPATVVLATGNADKLREMREILARWAIDVRPLVEFTNDTAVEDGSTFIENALLKARFAARVSGLAAVADDSGLEVDALEGAPGIYSARFAGPTADARANNAKLLRALAGVPDAKRTARYHCAIACVRGPDDRRPIVAEAQWEGRIAQTARGTGGFGYDPLFLVGAGAVTAAELPAEVKHAQSHRGRALRQLVAALTDNA